MDVDESDGLLPQDLMISDVHETPKALQANELTVSGKGPESIHVWFLMPFRFRLKDGPSQGEYRDDVEPKIISRVHRVSCLLVEYS